MTNTTQSSPAETLLAIDARGLEALWHDYECNLALAAYHLAYVINATQGYAKPTPSGAELVAAARRICAECGITLWTKSMLVHEVRALGFDVV